MVRAARRRYVALRAAGPAPPAGLLEERVLAAVRRHLPPAVQEASRPRVFHLAPGAAIVRVAPTGLAEVRAALDGLAVGEARLRTVATSGTMRRAKAALGVRASSRRRARVRRPKGPPP